MNEKKTRRTLFSLKKTFKPFVRTGLLLLVFLSACSPSVVPAAPVPVVSRSTDVPNTPIEIIPTATREPLTATPEVDPIYPYYMPLTIKPDVEPQTLKGVSVGIDWAYV